MKRAYWAALATLLSACFDPAFADPPADFSRAEEYSRAGTSSWGHEVPVGTTQAYVRTSTGASASAFDHAKMFRYGSLVSIACDAVAIFCWSQDTAATVATSGYIIDAGSTGPLTEGNRGCFYVVAGGYRDNVPSAGFFTRGHSQPATSQRSSACRGGAVSPNGTNGFPCDADADCVYAGSTCTANLRPDGAFLMNIAPAAATRCFVA